jgi:nucleoside-diphosphate-sugar epimerase
MHIFIAGAGGAVGRSLVPRLTAHGHTVTGTTRSAAKADALRELGAEPVVLDGLDRPAVLDAVAAARPDAIVTR